MHEAIIQLIHPHADWHVVALTPTTLDQVMVRETADFLICDHLSAHCPDMAHLLTEWVQVLKPNGWLAVVDTVVPGSRLRGKKANLQRRAGEYVNQLLRMVDGGNGRNPSVDEWLTVLHEVGMTQPQYQTNKHEIEFNNWLASAHLTPHTQTRLRAMLKQAPDPVMACLTPHSANDRITFFLTELTIVGRFENL